MTKKLILKLLSASSLIGLSSLTLISCSDSQTKVEVVDKTEIVALQVPNSIFIRVAEKERQELNSRDEDIILKYFSLVNQPDNKKTITDYIKFINARIEQPTKTENGKLIIDIVDTNDKNISNIIVIEKISDLIKPVTITAPITLEVATLEKAKIDARDSETLLKYFSPINSLPQDSNISELIKAITTTLVSSTDMKLGSLNIVLTDIQDNQVENNVSIQKLAPLDPSTPSLEELKKGGKKGSLTIDKFAPLIRSIDAINNTLMLRELTNEDIAQSLDKINNYKTLVLKISENSNEDTGTLILNVSGTFEGISIPSEVITITGFRDISKYNFVDNFKINNDAYIKNLQTNATTKTWTVDNIFNTYLSLFIAKERLADNPLDTVNIMEYQRKGFLTNFVFSNLNSTNQPITLNMDWLTKRYNATTNLWENNSSPKKITIRDITFTITERQIALFLSNSATLVANDNSSLYASALYSRWKEGHEIAGNYIKINQEVANHYFGNDIVSVGTHSIVVDDFYGQLKWEAFLSFSEGSLMNNQSFAISKELGGFKKTEDLKREPNKNFVLVSTLAPRDGFLKNFKRDLRPLLSKLELNKEIQFDVTSFPRSFGTLNNGMPLYTSDSADFNVLNIFYNQGIQFHGDFFFHKTILEDLSEDRSGLLGGIYIETIYSDFPEGQKIGIAKLANNTFRLNTNINLQFQYLSPFNNFLTRELSLEFDDSLDGI